MDVREVLKALSPEDRILWSQARTEIRRVYLNTHNMTVGIEKWDNTDDQFTDWIDIKLATLFDRGGYLSAATDVIGAEDAKPIEAAIEADDDRLKEKKVIAPSAKLLENAWSGK